MGIDIQARHDFVFSRRTDTDAYDFWASITAAGTS